MDDGYVRYRIHVRTMSGVSGLREVPCRRRGLSHRGSDGSRTWGWRVMQVVWWTDRQIWGKAGCLPGRSTKVARGRASRIRAGVARVGDMAVRSGGRTVACIWDSIEKKLLIQCTRGTGLERGVWEGLSGIVLFAVRGAV